MSIKFTSDLIFDIYIKKELINNTNFKDKNDLEDYLRVLFKTLKEKYNIEISGFYDITVYIDKYYGVILHLEKEEMDYYDYFKNQVDMKLVIKETEFLYEVYDIPKCLCDKVKIYIKNDNIYLKVIKDLTSLQMMKLIEHSRIVYDN